MSSRTLILFAFFLVLAWPQRADAQQKKDKTASKALVYKGKTIDQIFDGLTEETIETEGFEAFYFFEQRGKDYLFVKLKGSELDVFKALQLLLYFPAKTQEECKQVEPLLDHKNPFIAALAALSFTNVNPPLKKPYKKLNGMLKHESGLIRVAAALALWWNHPRPKILISHLKEGLSLGHIMIQVFCLRCIQKIGSAVKQTLPAVLKILEKDSSPHTLKREALEAVGALGVQPMKDMGGILALLKKGNLKYHAALALRKSKKLPKSIADILHKMRVGSNKRLREAAAIAMLVSHSKSQEILMQVVEIEASTSKLSNLASKVIYLADPDPIQLQLCYLQSSNEEVRLLAIQAFVEAEDGSVALPFLIKGLADKNETVRDECADAIVEIGGLDKAQQKQLRALLKHPNKTTQALAKRVLSQLKQSD